MISRSKRALTTREGLKSGKAKAIAKEIWHLFWWALGWGHYVEESLDIKEECISP